MSKVVNLGEFRKRQEDEAKRPADPKTADQKSAVPKAPTDLRRAMVREAAQDIWAGKFRVETPDGKTEDHADPDTMLAFSAMLGGMDIQQVLNKLVRRDERQIRAYKEVVAGYSTEEIQAWLEKPKDRDLQKKPYFYHALIDEAKRRFIAMPMKSGGDPTE